MIIVLTVRLSARGGEQVSELTPPLGDSPRCGRSIRYRRRMSDDATPSGPTRAPTSTRRAVLNTMKGSAGNLVEWYDVYIYTVFATYFEAQFFDENDENSTLYIYGIFAVTFVMRPVGSWFFGRFADRRGRKAA